MRVHIWMDEKLVRRVESYRFRARHESRSAAFTALVERGLAVSSASQVAPMAEGESGKPKKREGKDGGRE